MDTRTKTYVGMLTGRVGNPGLPHVDSTPEQSAKGGGCPVRSLGVQNLTKR